MQKMGSCGGLSLANCKTRRQMGFGARTPSRATASFACPKRKNWGFAIASIECLVCYGISVLVVSLMRLRFLPQTLLDSWMDQKKVDLLPDRLLCIQSGKEYSAKEAALFLQLTSGSDSAGIINKVKSLEQIRALGAESFQNSVVLGDAAYEVEGGWIVDEEQEETKSDKDNQTPASDNCQNQDANQKTGSISQGSVDIGSLMQSSLLQEKPVESRPSTYQSTPEVDRLAQLLLEKLAP